MDRLGAGGRRPPGPDPGVGFRPGQQLVNWLAGMHAGTRDAARTIAVLSGTYLGSVYGSAAWQAAMATDPDGTSRKLLVVRVATASGLVCSPGSSGGSEERSVGKECR